MKLNFYLATKNKNKLVEVREILNGTGISVLACPEDVIFPEEKGETFEDNAFMKARFLRNILGDENVVGEDSGLSVDRINGLPGVFSARFAGENCGDSENISKLLDLIKPYRNTEDRKAEFITTVAFAGSREERIFKGVIKGHITLAPRGHNGFGYDPIFEIYGTGKTFAEMSFSEKNKISHRQMAFRKLANYLMKV